MYIYLVTGQTNELSGSSLSFPLFLWTLFVFLLILFHLVIYITQKCVYLNTDVDTNYYSFAFSKDRLLFVVSGFFLIESKIWVLLSASDLCFFFCIISNDTSWNLLVIVSLCSDISNISVFFYKMLNVQNLWKGDCSQLILDANQLSRCLIMVALDCRFMFHYDSFKEILCQLYHIQRWLITKIWIQYECV